MPGSPLTTHGYRTLSRRTYFALAVLFGGLGISVTAAAAAPAPVPLIMAVVATALTAIGTLSWPNRPRRMLLEFAAGVGVIGWLVAAASGGSPALGFALFLPLGYAIATRRPWWPWALLTFTTLLVSVLLSQAHAGIGMAGQVVALFFLGTELIVFLAVELSWVIFTRMDAHRASENELAIVRERLRFADDLHDVQGHTLLAIKLKAELARRSLDADPTAAGKELADIESLVSEVSAQTRRIANDYRTAHLPSELANARQLLSAAGIAHDIDPPPSAAGDGEELMATVVREGISNIFKHSDATTVSIRFGPGEVTVVNDGLRPQPTSDENGGNGLDGLRRRIVAHGGTLEARRVDDAFRLDARFPAERSAE